MCRANKQRCIVIVYHPLEMAVQYRDGDVDGDDKYAQCRGDRVPINQGRTRFELPCPCLSSQPLLSTRGLLVHHCECHDHPHASCKL